MTDDEIASRGVKLAAQTMRLTVDGRDQEVLSLLTSAPELEVRWCALYLVGAIALVAETFAGSPEEGRQLIRNAADGAEVGDAFDVAAAVMIDAWWRQYGGTS